MKNFYAMKKNGFLLLLAWIAPLFSLQAQNAALGERVSEVKTETWLGGVRPMTAPLTVIAFFAASNPACVKSLEQLYALTEKSGERLRVILVTRDDDAKISPVVTPYLSPRFTVAFDTDGKIFKNFGVNYVPFSLLTDARNRVLGQGNSLHLTDKIVSSAQ